jgi:hypothetical protein
MERTDRIGRVSIDRKAPVHTAWDIGFSDATAIWFYQVFRNEVRLVDYYEASGKDIEHYCDVLKAKASDPSNPFKYGDHNVPHDAAHKLLAAKGRSIVQQSYAKGIKMKVVPATSHINNVAAARKLLDIAYADEVNCKQGLEAARSYHYRWDDKKKMLSELPVHDWSSHGCNALEIIGRVWQSPSDDYDLSPAPLMWQEKSFDDIFWEGIRQ